MKALLKIFRRLLQSILLFLELFLAFGAIYFLFMIFGHYITTGEIYTNKEPNKIYISSNGVHTDIVLPLKNELHNWDDFLDLTPYNNSKQAQYIAIGWGDKGFYLDTPTWSDLKASTAINAALLPSPTAMHVSLYSKEPQVGERIKLLYVPNHNYSQLIHFILGSFDLENDQPILIPNSGYTSNDNFYEAKGNYHLFKTCNTWTNLALKSANLKTGIWALYQDAILYPYQ